MRAVKSTDTHPERAVSSLVKALGYRFTLNRKDLPGRPDLAFLKLRRVIFVHGCFWHGHSCGRGARVPKTNVEYWTRKVETNRTRDAKVRSTLRRLGWHVLTIWECQLAKPVTVRRRINAFLQAANS